MITAGDLGQDLYFMEPSMEFAEEISAYRQEMMEADSDFDGCLSLKRMSDPKEWVDYCLEWGNPSRELKEQGVRGTLLMCVRKEDNRLVGMIQIHHNMNDVLRGIDSINISCLTNNEASRRTILANGGQYRDTVHVPEDNIDLERYWIL